MNRFYSISDFAEACDVSTKTMAHWLHDICSEALLRRGLNVQKRKRYNTEEALIIADYLGFTLPE